MNLLLNPLALTLDSLKLRLRNRVVLLEELHDLRLLLSLSEHERRDSFLVKVLRVRPILEQVLNGLQFDSLDSVVERRLSIVVNQIQISAKTDKLLDGFGVSFSRCIEDGRLSVSVNVIHIATSLSNEEVYQLKLAFSRSVVECGLIESVRLVRLNSKVPQDLSHPYSMLIILDERCREHWSLFVVHFINELTEVVATNPVLLDNLVDVSILNHLQELLHVCLHLLSSLAHLLSLLWIHQRGELRTGRSLS